MWEGAGYRPRSPSPARSRAKLLWTQAERRWEKGGDVYNVCAACVITFNKFSNYMYF